MNIPQAVTALSLLEANGGTVYGRTRMQKLMFLVQKELDLEDPPFTYVAWDYGPYSKDLQGTLNTLVDLGFIKEAVKKVQAGHEAYRYELTSNGRETLTRLLGQASAPTVEDLRTVVSDWSDAELDDLVRHVYDRNPEFASRSKYFA